MPDRKAVDKSCLAKMQQRGASQQCLGKNRGVHRFTPVCEEIYEHPCPSQPFGGEAA
jgi:hypothetical protein